MVKKSLLNDTCSHCRSSHRRLSVKKGVLRSFPKYTGKHLCQSLCLRPETLSKKRLWHKCFSVNFATFLRTSFLQNTSGRLLLSVTPLFDIWSQFLFKEHTKLKWPYCSYRSSNPEMFFKKCVRKKTSQLSCNFIKKEILAQVFSDEFCEISRNIFFL